MIESKRITTQGGTRIRNFLIIDPSGKATSPLSATDSLPVALQRKREAVAGWWLRLVGNVSESG